MTLPGVGLTTPTTSPCRRRVQDAPGGSVSTEMVEVVPVVMVAQAVQLVLAVQEAQEVPVLTVWLWHLVALVHQVIPEQLVIKVLPELKALLV